MYNYKIYIIYNISCDSQVTAGLIWPYNLYI